MQILNVLPAGDCWAVDYANTSEAPRIMELFGTTLIPTAFTRACNSHEASLRALKAAAVCLDPESEAAGIRLTKAQRAEALAMVYAALEARGAK